MTTTDASGPVRQPELLKALRLAASLGLVISQNGTICSTGMECFLPPEVFAAVQDALRNRLLSPQDRELLNPRLVRMSWHYLRPTPEGWRTLEALEQQENNPQPESAP